MEVKIEEHIFLALILIISFIPVMVHLKTKKRPPLHRGKRLYLPKPIRLVYGPPHTRQPSAAARPSTLSLIPQ